MTRPSPVHPSLIRLRLLCKPPWATISLLWNQPWVTEHANGEYGELAYNARGSAASAGAAAATTARSSFCHNGRCSATMLATSTGTPQLPLSYHRASALLTNCETCSAYSCGCRRRCSSATPRLPLSYTSATTAPAPC